MPRNRYTRFVRTIEQHRRVSQEKELTKMARELRRDLASPVDVPLLLTAKQRRSTRLQQNSHHRHARKDNVLDLRSPQPATPELRTPQPSSGHPRPGPQTINSQREKKR